MFITDGSILIFCRMPDCNIWLLKSDWIWILPDDVVVAEDNMNCMLVASCWGGLATNRQLSDTLCNLIGAGFYCIEETVSSYKARLTIPVPHVNALFCLHDHVCCYIGLFFR